MSDRLPDLEALLRRQGAMSSAQIGQALGVSQPTVSRLLAAAGDGVVRMGRARATRYALARQVGRAGRRWPLYRIGPDGRAHLLGELHALHGDGYYFATRLPHTALLHGDLASGLFDGLPWFLDDQRPQGFLGRALARRVAETLGATPDLMRWQSDDVLLALLHHTEDPPGDLVLGEPALQRALQQIVQPVGAIAHAQRQQVYPRQAEAALRGEDIGSSAGGEQPKFTATLALDDGFLPVIVKFSGRTDTAAGQRWADLLRCEHIASHVLRRHGLDAAHSEIVEADSRVFLQSMRFDRTPALGRRGFISAAALDAAFHGHGRIDWWLLAGELHRDGWIDTGDARRLRLLGWFGALIANSDMHLGNVGLVLTDTRPLALAPTYDMLPMAFRPTASGELVERDYDPPLPTPEFREDWLEAARMATGFWREVADSAAISPGYRSIAASILDRLLRSMDRIG